MLYPREFDSSGCDMGLEELWAPNSHLMAVLNYISATPV